MAYSHQLQGCIPPQGEDKPSPLLWTSRYPKVVKPLGKATAPDDPCKGLQMWLGLAWRRQAPPLLYTHDGHNVYSSGGACLRHARLHGLVECLQNFWVMGSP